ncbi:MAG TPA: protein translocase subunit SecD [Rhabdochlamydiaceae bacterium]|nr:protein translocase subunit SecD [Rhabdochlamydiaceae bacterium]
MERPKRWQLFLIAAVIFLTVYNILPTVFFYSKPLKSPIDQKRAEKIETDIAVRVNSLEGESLAWIGSFCDLLKLKPLSIALDASNPQFVQIKFKDHSDAKKFRNYLPRAGSLIGFVPAQLDVYDRDLTSKTVIVQRRIPVQLDNKKLQNYFQFGSKRDAQGHPTEFYRSIVDDRLVFLGTSAGGTSENASLIQTSISHLQDPAAQDLLFMLSQNLLNFTKVFDENSAIAKRYFASFSQIDVPNQKQFIDQWIGALERLKDQVRLERIALSQEKESLVSEGKYLETVKQQRLEWLNNRENLLINSAALVKKHVSDFSAGKTPLNFTTMKASLKESGTGIGQTIDLKGHHPFIESLTVDWDSERIVLNLYPDVQQMKDHLPQGYQRDQIDQLIYNDVASLSRQAGEKIKPYLDRFEIQISMLPDSQTFVAMRLYNIAKAEAETMRATLAGNWLPQHPDLQRSVFPIWDYETYQSLPADQKKLGLVVFAPSMQSKMPPKGFKMNSIYVVAKGVDKILERFESQDSDAAKQFIRDFNELRSILQKNGFTGYSGGAYPIASEFKSDFIFEHEDYYQDILKATREDFSVHGTKRYALLEFSNVEQRILTENKIDNRLHEDLLKWRDDYRAAQVDLKGTTKYDVPAPTSNILWDNFKLSCVKYFRGDERKVIRWGLDLSGGKTVQIELRDNNNRVVTNEADIRQGINELYNRVNKMGVSEVSIRQEGNSIALDFPGSQSLSASELVKASSMYFHIVNEKFMTNQTIAEATHRFLQDVWNEAIVTNRKDIEEINLIAWRHLYGESTNPDAVQPRSAAAKTLYENGLRLAHPQESISSSNLDETFSKISMYRGDDFTDWHGQTHPLLVVFRNYALEGSNLENVRGSYDPSKGNFLAFGVQGSHSAKDGLKISPRDDLQAWTSQYSKEKIAGTPLEAYSRGHGWRMAVILNGTVITAPTLDSTLRDSASISGSFTQREINRLEADLKAGSLSFTPRILSEKNVSPELGGQERLHGIIATVCALALAILTMICYYRFGGFIASIAVLFNLLIMWAALQNIGATLTLAQIAGIILSVAMAVDANVLVFERIREEFAISGRIAAAVHAGYRKAFSAIVDSNITTLIAALILMHFDAGPIRGFAVTLIIGIICSLFTALFMTRYFFNWWFQNPEHRELKMANFIKGAHFNFLKFTKPTLIISAIVILIGSYLLLTQRQTILGMDFTGGYALTVELPVSAKNNYRAEVEHALTAQGLTTQEFQIRELHPSNNVRIFLSRSLEQKGRPFAGLPISIDAAEATYPFENNPKISWIVGALQTSHIQLTPQVLQDLDQNWTAISGQMSDTMRTHAIIGICIALLCILVYITIRFEFKYALSATLCLIHDVIFCVGVLAILHLLGVPIQIDLHTVAALMTIVGYSLNDTIIVFDRIREDTRLMRKNSLTEIINHALNVTLSRTLMTSGITLLVLIPLIVLGGSTIFGFALVMAIGVIFGTLSSLFIAAPLMQYFHNREMQKRQRLALHEQ